MNPTFSYTPLSNPRDEIRLLTLLPTRFAWKLEGEDDDEAQPIIECRLETFSLGDYFPPYMTWLDSRGRDCNAKLRSKQWHAYVRRWADENAKDEDERKSWAKTANNRFKWGDYWALSYIWGDASKTQTILLNEAPFRVTENLHAALRKLVEEHHHVEDGDKLWVDAICINQCDLAEREHEVTRMGQIYSDARSVEV